MSWIILGLASHLSWAFVNVGDKYVVGNRVKNEYVYMIWITMLGILSVLIIPFIDFQFHLSARQFLLLLFPSALYVFGGFPYIHALKIEEVTRINIWWNLIPLFSLVFGYVLFGEVLSGHQLIAFAILLLSAIVASLHANGKSISFSRAFWFMMMATFCYALYAVIVHEVSKTMNLGSIFVWYHIFAFFWAGSALLIPNIRRAFAEEVLALSPKTGALIFGISFIDHLGVFFSQWAITLASAALVFSIEGSQVLFVFLMTIFISRKNKNLLREQFDSRNLFLKICAVVLMFVGIGVLSVG